MPVTLELGDASFDLTHRALVMGILNRTPDSFYDDGETYELDALISKADRLVTDGADILDIGGVKAGPGPEVSEGEELDRVVGSVEAVAARVDVAISVDTWRASVAAESYKAGAVMGNDISGFGDPDYLRVASAAGASVVATHIRLAPRVPDPDPHYEDLLGEVRAFLAERALRALDFGIPRERIVLDVGLDLGKTPEQSLELLRNSDDVAGLGYPLLLSASNKTFLGATLGLDITGRKEASLAACALGFSLGCRIMRVHDVAGTKRVVRTLEAISKARRDR
ncbi:MAG: dihydropteroate synthase [Actinobacteria bacterium]|nr:dihydropteroate synthase [Actinomycetota bacterium]MCL5444571.1 dihydropteroate synthase [Actinomycetota bacterium]